MTAMAVNDRDVSGGHERFPISSMTVVELAAFLRVSRSAKASSAGEVAAASDDATGMLPLDIDPKLAWALKFRQSFPVDVNRAPREALLRVPGLGLKAIDGIIAARRWRALRLADVARLTVSIARLRPFIVALDWRPVALADQHDLRPLVAPRAEQLELFAA